MRYAIVSDIHANLSAWETVLADATAHGTEMIICLGDVVGYGPQPAETLTSVHKHVDYFVLGNHDAALCGLLSTETFNDDAAEMIRWTRGQIAPKAIDFLKKQPLTLHGDGFICVHGTANAPETFDYVFEESDTRACLQATDTPLVFVGHTHCAGIHYLNREGEFRCVEGIDFEIEEGKRYVVNPGSVGMARGDDFRASYCIFDSEEHSITFRQVAYDLTALRAAAHSRAPECVQLNYVLDLFDENRKSPVRESVDFSPSASATEGYATDGQIELGLRRWRRAFVAAMLLVTVLGSSSWILWKREAPLESVEPLVVQAINHSPFELGHLGLPQLELIRKDSASPENAPLANLSFSLSHPDESSVRKTACDQIELSNTALDGEISLSSPRLKLGDLSKIQVFALLDAETDDLPALFIDLILSDQSIVEGVDFKRPVRLRTGEYRIQRTTRTLPKDAVAAVLRLHWAGTGKVTVKQFSIRPKR